VCRVACTESLVPSLGFRVPRVAMDRRRNNAAMCGTHNQASAFSRRERCIRIHYNNVCNIVRVHTCIGIGTWWWGIIRRCMRARHDEAHQTEAKSGGEINQPIEPKHVIKRRERERVCRVAATHRRVRTYVYDRACIFQRHYHPVYFSFSPARSIVSSRTARPCARFISFIRLPNIY